MLNSPIRLAAATMMARLTIARFLSTQRISSHFPEHIVLEYRKVDSPFSEPAPDVLYRSDQRRRFLLGRTRAETCLRTQVVGLDQVPGFFRWMQPDAVKPLELGVLDHIDGYPLHVLYQLGSEVLH